MPPGKANPPMPVLTDVLAISYSADDGVYSNFFYDYKDPGGLCHVSSNFVSNQ